MKQSNYNRLKIYFIEINKQASLYDLNDLTMSHLCPAPFGITLFEIRLIGFSKQRTIYNLPLKATEYRIIN